MAGGRPTTYSPELAGEILTRICEGETVTKICKTEGMPNRSTVWLWSSTHPDFSIQYARAITCLGQCHTDSLDEIDDMLLRGEIDAQTARVLSDNKKWRASKFYPKMYSERQIVESKNENLNANVEIKLSDADMAILQRFGFDSEN